MKASTSLLALAFLFGLVHSEDSVEPGNADSLDSTDKAQDEGKILKMEVATAERVAGEKPDNERKGKNDGPNAEAGGEYDEQAESPDDDEDDDEENEEDGSSGEEEGDADNDDNDGSAGNDQGEAGVSERPDQGDGESGDDEEEETPMTPSGESSGGGPESGNGTSQNGGGVGSSCNLDTDCSEMSICVNDKCSARKMGCRSNSDCTSGARCSVRGSIKLCHKPGCNRISLATKATRLSTLLRNSVAVVGALMLEINGFGVNRPPNYNLRRPSQGGMPNVALNKLPGRPMMMKRKIQASGPIKMANLKGKRRLRLTPKMKQRSKPRRGGPNRGARGRKVRGMNRGIRN